MKLCLRLKHWQAFGIFTILYVLIFVLQINDFVFWNISSKELEITTTIFLLILFFLWLLGVGLFLNGLPNNPHQINKRLLIFAVIAVLIGYSDLNLKRLGFDNGIPLWFSFVTTPLSLWGIAYIFYNISKSVTSLELGRKVKLSECLWNLSLLVFFPIGIWVLQPKLNKMLVVEESEGNKKM